MRRNFFRAIFTMLISLTALAVFVVPANAHSTQSQSAKAVCSGFQHTHVVLDGSKILKIKCEAGTLNSVLNTHAAVGESPLVTKDGSCNVTSLWLYDNASLPPSVQEICFTSSNGTGLVNLTDYSHVSSGLFGPVIDTWRWAPTSYYAGCSSGSFYSDLNQGGNHIRYGTYSSGNIPSNFGMSSLTMDIKCS